MLGMKPGPSLLLILMGSIDCLTTVVGVLYFGAVELNPLITEIVSTNLLGYTILKLTATAFITLIFILAEKILMQTRNKNNRAFARTLNLLKFTYAGMVLFLVIAVANNVLVIANVL